jgi:hypothetical protein
LRPIRPSGKITLALPPITDMNIVSLKAARSRLRQGRPVQPPPALTSPVPAGARAHPDDADDRMRMRQNLAALTVIVCIVALGTWLMESLTTYSRIQTCIEAGHRNCVPVDHKYQPSPYGRPIAAGPVR